MPSDPTETIADLGPPHQLRILVQTPHGERVRGAAVALCRCGESPGVAAEEIDGVYMVVLEGEGAFELLVQAGDGRGTGASAFDHRPFGLTLLVRPPEGGGVPILEVQAAASEGVSLVEDVRVTSEGWVLRVVLDYLWFTPIGTPPTLGNRATILIDGEEAWGAVADAIESATKRVHVTTWLYHETAELRRPEPLAEPGERAANTAHRMFTDAASRGVTVRLLLWDAPFLDMSEGTAAAAVLPGDNFEVLQEANLAESNVLRADQFPVLSELVGNWPLHSFHQKTFVVDGKVGFCGGMNLTEHDWDGPRHRLFDPRRTRFSRASSFRKLVLGRTTASDHAPRHDVMGRVEGPAVEHLEANFRERWNALRESLAQARLVQEAEGPSGRDTTWETACSDVQPAAGPWPAVLAGSTAVQVIRTMPPPADERGILDVYLRAIRAARRLIYVESQFFRSTHVSDAIAEAVRARPELQVIVVTVRTYADSLLQSGWSWECFRRIEAVRPGFQLYTLVITEVDEAPIVHRREVDIHAKLLMVDDVFLTLGSCNIHDRGFELEAEINLAVVDPALVRATRLRLWREHLADDARLTGDIESDVQIWHQHADRNRAEITSGASNVVPFVPVERESIFDRHAW